MNNQTILISLFTLRGSNQEETEFLSLKNIAITFYFF